MMGFVIEKGVPIHGVQGIGGRPLLHRWDLMEIDDSVVVGTRGASNSAKTWGARHGRKFVVRKQTNQPFGYRVWRVE